jgi:hypothetical protein
MLANSKTLPQGHPRSYKCTSFPVMTLFNSTSYSLFCWQRHCVNHKYTHKRANCMESSPYLRSWQLLCYSTNFSRFIQTSFLTDFTKLRFKKQINQPDATLFHEFITRRSYVSLNMFRASPRPLSGAYNCTRSLWFYLWKETAGTLLVVIWPVRPRPTTLQPFPSKGKTRGS